MREKQRSAEAKGGWFLRSGKRSLLFLGVPALEPFDAARRIDELLLPREEWMASPADADVHGFPGRSGMHRVATGAMDRGLDVLRMNFSFHSVPKDRAMYASISGFAR